MFLNRIVNFYSKDATMEKMRLDKFSNVKHAEHVFITLTGDTVRLSQDVMAHFNKLQGRKKIKEFHESVYDAINLLSMIAWYAGKSLQTDNVNFYEFPAESSAAKSRSKRKKGKTMKKQAKPAKAVKQQPVPPAKQTKPVAKSRGR